MNAGSPEIIIAANPAAGWLAACSFPGRKNKFAEEVMLRSNA
ncbi:MAG TPA: hypothetical protein VGH81_05080 [Rudaea sp.]|jgi:hypothetical protein